MFEYDNGILVCKEHRTPAQKNDRDVLWCRKCDDGVAEAVAIREAAAIAQHGLTGAGR